VLCLCSVFLSGGITEHIAEGNFNFTSTAQQKPHVEIESDDDAIDDDGDRGIDLEVLDQPEVGHIEVNQRQSRVEHVEVNQRQSRVEHVEVNQRQSRVEHVEVNQTSGVGPSTNKPTKRKRSPKIKPKSSGEALVGVMDRFVNIKEKEVNNEAAQQFTISKCIAALRTLEGFDPAKKPKAFVVFKSVDNREIFLSSVEDNDGSALAWLNGEMAMLP
jgi:hypothetical protein